MSERGRVSKRPARERPTRGRPGAPAGGAAIATLPAWAFALVAACAVAGTIAGFSAFDHCATFGCDFTMFHAQGASVLASPFRVAPGWRLPPFAALVFAPFGAASLATATWAWEALNVVLACVLAGMCAGELRGHGRIGRVVVAIALVAGSLPVLHDLKWGQVSLVVGVGAIAALRWRRGGGIGLGLLAAFKAYPIAYALEPLAERRFKTVAMVAAVAAVFGVLLPLVLLGPDRTAALAANLLASAPGSGAWANDRSIAYYGGQSLGASIERWIGDGGHIGRTDGSAAGLVATLPGLLVTAIAVLASVAVLGVTVLALRRRPPAHAAALCLTGVTLVVPPGWHHYFAFLPWAQAVALGGSSRRAGWLAAASWLAAAAPLAALGFADGAYFGYSAWGGTTVSALLAWCALLFGDSNRIPVQAGPSVEPFLPGFRGRSRRPVRVSSSRTNDSEPAGRPVLVALRILSFLGSSSPSPSHLDQSGMIPGTGHARSRRVLGAFRTCTAALDHGKAHGSATIPARTGLSSTYRTAAQRWASSSGVE